MNVSASASASAVIRRSVAVTNLLLRKQLWIWPLLAAAGLAAIGYWLKAHVEQSLKTSMASQLQVILAADVAALEQWLESQRSNAETAAASRARADLAGELISLANKPDTSPVELAQAPQLAALRASIGPWMKAQGYIDFIVTDRRCRIVAAGQTELIGKENLASYEEFLNTALTGQATVSRPFPSLVLLSDEKGRLRANVPTMFAAAPLRDRDDQIIGVLAFRLRPERDFTRILNVAHFGSSGETYAFDRDGLMLSQSRFDDDLKRMGLLPDSEESHSILTLQLRDPQVDMSLGERPPLRRAEQPLTRLAADAVLGQSGVDVDGYRDYRGVPNIGAWTWLPEYGIGVATEVDLADAYRPTRILRLAFWGLFGLLAACSVGIFAFSIVVARLQHAMRQAALATKTLGQYQLEEQIGAGGMGVVYRGRHALLRRATAIKLLNVDKTTPDTIRRFEREVQITSQLNHPNTIAIYDYGHTPEGVFYYAMELLEGIDLEQLVQRYGPLPEGRVIFILRQVCGSLSEAHRIGLIHRDVKPANVIFTCRGGVPDFAKLVYFGLVKAIGGERDASLTAAGAVTGTPLYLSPEAIQHPDQVDRRTDIYAVGAMGYYLLTGMPVFEAKSVVDILMHHVHTPPQPPSQRSGKFVSPELEAIVLRCLAKEREDRPSTAQELADALARCSTSGGWTEAEAAAWWECYTGNVSVNASASLATPLPAGDETAICTKQPDVGASAPAPNSQTIEHLSRIILDGSSDA
ncbi:MAG TPA: serine/threonine protein kinase [Pirellulales bacterium]|nr:serine/threonine protein kinase [Pirellulales bacterium]